MTVDTKESALCQDLGFHHLPSHCRPLYASSPFGLAFERSSTKALLYESKQSFLCYLVKRKYSCCNSVFPIASCTSGRNESTHQVQSGETEQGQGQPLKMPGIQVRGKTGTMGHIFGEYEVKQLLEKESGWDRVKEMYTIKSWQFQDEGTRVVNTLFFRTLVVGFLFNAIFVKKRSLKTKTKKFMSKAEALMRGPTDLVPKPQWLVRGVLMETFKVSVFAFSIMYIPQTLAAIRNETSVWDFTLAGGLGVCGALDGSYRFGTGHSILAGSVIGTIVGVVACKALRSAEWTQEMRSLKKIQARVEEQRLKAGDLDWK